MGDGDDEMMMESTMVMVSTMVMMTSIIVVSRLTRFQALVPNTISACLTEHEHLVVDQSWGDSCKSLCVLNFVVFFLTSKPILND